MPVSLWWEWLAYYEMDPFGRDRDDLRAGIIAATVANAAHGRKRRKTYKPKDFMPKFDRRPKSWQQMLKMVEELNAAMGGVDLRKDKEGA